MKRNVVETDKVLVKKGTSSSGRIIRNKKKLLINIEKTRLIILIVNRNKYYIIWIK